MRMATGVKICLHLTSLQVFDSTKDWIPASAGMTKFFAFREAVPLLPVQKRRCSVGHNPTSHREYAVVGVVGMTDSLALHVTNPKGNDCAYQ